VSRRRAANVGEVSPEKRYERFKEENARWDRRVKEAVEKIGKPDSEKSQRNGSSRSSKPAD